MTQTQTAPDLNDAPAEAPAHAAEAPAHAAGAPAHAAVGAADAVLVLGMHRSGTSALARSLNLAGVELGDDLLPAAADNEQGFWEHRQIQFIHDRIYEALGRDWTHVSPLPPAWWDRAEIWPHRQILREELRQDFGQFPLWGVKDPRLCAMLPLWLPLLADLGVTPRCVLIVRNPGEVARSLAARDGMPPSRALLLWVRSVVDAERHSRGLPRAVVSFDQLLTEGPGLVDRVGRELGIAWPALADPARSAGATAALAESLRPAARHQRVADAAFLADPATPAPVRDLYAAALAAAASGRADDLSAAADAAARALDEDPLLSRFVTDLEAEQRATVIAKNEQALHLHTHLTKSHHAGAAAHVAYVEAKGRADASDARLADLDRQAVEREAALATARAEAERLRAAAAAHAAEVDRLSAEVEAARIRLRESERAAADAAADAGREAAAATAATARTVAAADRRAAELDRDLAGLRFQVAVAYRARDILGESLRNLLRSRLWTWGAAGRVVARALGRSRVGGEKLVPAVDGPVRGPGLHQWHGTAAPQFLVPITPMVGWARLRVTLKSSVASRAALYFDTGGGFHQREHLELAPVAGDTVIDRMVALRQPTYLLRFDPVQAAGEWSVESFSFEPMSRVWFNASAVLGNVAKLVTGRGTHRPSPWLGLKLVLGGDFSKFHRQLVSNVESTTAVSEYDLWRKAHAITDEGRQRMRDTVATWADPPLISVVLPVYNVPEVYLRACLDSVLRQTYRHWELCVADDASPKPHVRRVLAEYAARDERVKVVIRPKNGNISAASNSALALATGPYMALLDHDDELAEHALFAVAEQLVADPSLDMVYSDEDKVTPAGKHFDPFFKPDWSPEYFLACMYTCHLGVYRTELVRKLGGWRSAFDSSQDYDLVLRLTATNPKIHHVPDVLYHWRTIPTSTASGAGAKPEASDRARAALQNYLDLTGRPGSVEDGPSPGFHRVRYQIRGDPLVSIVIPSACRAVEVRGRQTWFVLEAVSSIRRLSTYKNLEILVLDNHDMADGLARQLEPLDVRRLHYADPGGSRFNLARKLNQGGFAARGEQLILLNDDVEVISPDWVEALLGFSQWPDIGAVGPQLLFPDDVQQHNGVNLLEGNPGHPFYMFPGDHPGYFNSSVVHRNWSAVTGACLMTRADVYKRVGGFSEHFPLNYNDVDYCLKVRQLGLRVVYTPYAKLYHHESVSKAGTDEAELAAFKAEWADRVPRDPYYNPNLSMHTCDFRIG